VSVHCGWVIKIIPSLSIKDSASVTVPLIEPERPISDSMAMTANCKSRPNLRFRVLLWVHTVRGKKGAGLFFASLYDRGNECLSRLLTPAWAVQPIRASRMTPQEIVQQHNPSILCRRTWFVHAKRETLPTKSSYELRYHNFLLVAHSYLLEYENSERILQATNHSLQSLIDNAVHNTSAIVTGDLAGRQFRMKQNSSLAPHGKQTISSSNPTGFNTTQAST
jgi:hypothetical protein